LNNGTCADIHTGLEDLIGSSLDQDYACICKAGYKGKNCETGNFYPFYFLNQDVAGFPYSSFV
jgi:hypothetical protein